MGESVSYRRHVVVEDNIDSSEQITLTIDSSKVNLSEVGEYAVKYTATDRAGNSSSVTIFVKVIDPKFRSDSNAAIVLKTSCRG